MEDKNSELLFEYLRSILYDKKIQPLDVEQLDEPFRKLGRGLQYFAKTFTETKQYAAALSRGNLSVQPPPRENFLCENLKNIHANLNHLTWQAKQVAKGDYSQTVSYLGEFSEAFNTMTQQLKERELKLKQEAERHRTEIAAQARQQTAKTAIYTFSRENEDGTRTTVRVRAANQTVAREALSQTFLNRATLCTVQDGERYEL